MNLNLKADFKQLSKGLNNMQKTQLPFVISKTINEVAFASIDKNNPEGLKQKAKIHLKVVLHHLLLVVLDLKNLPRKT